MDLTLSEDEASAIVHAAYRQFLEAVPSTDTLLRVAKCSLSTATREHSLRSVELYEEYLVGALVGAKTILEQKPELAGQYAAKLETIAKDASTYVPKGPRNLSDWLSCKPGCAQFRLPVQRLRTVPRGG